MESIKKDTCNTNNSKILIFSIIGIVLFFIPIKINNQYETIIYHISYFVDNKSSAIVDISIVFFIVLSICKSIFNEEKTSRNRFKIIIKIFSLIILISILVGKEEIFFINDDFILILKDLILDLSIFLPISSLFIPFLLDYGLPEIIESYTHKMMKKLFKVSGKVFLNILVYLFVNNVCGAFVTYRLYKDGKLREREALITILNFSILSLTLTGDLCYKINISMIKFFMMEMITLIICNFVISRIYPLKKKKQSYYFKSGHKNVNCRRHKINTAIKKYKENKSDKNLVNLSLSYFNDVIYILMDLIPLIVFIFFVSNLIYNIPVIMDMINNLLYIFINKFNIPNDKLITDTISLNFFSSILAIKNMEVETYYISKIMIGLFISLQCINLCFLIPFIKTSVFNIKIEEIVIVAIERFIIIMIICFISYNFYIRYMIS